MSENDLRPRRSVLYMPGANERALEKAKGLAADALILDLEDAVSPDAKAEARERVVAAAAEGRHEGVVPHAAAAEHARGAGGNERDPHFPSESLPATAGRLSAPA